MPIVMNMKMYNGTDSINDYILSNTSQQMCKPNVQKNSTSLQRFPTDFANFPIKFMDPLLVI